MACPAVESSDSDDEDELGEVSDDASSIGIPYQPQQLDSYTFIPLIPEYQTNHIPSTQTKPQRSTVLKLQDILRYYGTLRLESQLDQGELYQDSESETDQTTQTLEDTPTSDDNILPLCPAPDAGGNPIQTANSLHRRRSPIVLRRQPPRILESILKKPDPDYWIHHNNHKYLHVCFEPMIAIRWISEDGKMLDDEDSVYGQMLRYNPHAQDTDVTSYIDDERYRNKTRRGPIRPVTPSTDYDHSNFAALRAIAYAHDLAAGYGPTEDTETGETIPEWKPYPRQLHKILAYHAKDGNAYKVNVPQSYSITRNHQPKDIYEQIPQKELYENWYNYRHIYYSAKQTYEIHQPAVLTTPAQTGKSSSTTGIRLPKRKARNKSRERDTPIGAQSKTLQASQDSITNSTNNPATVAATTPERPHNPTTTKDTGPAEHDALTMWTSRDSKRNLARMKRNNINLSSDESDDDTVMLIPGQITPTGLPDTPINLEALQRRLTQINIRQQSPDSSSSSTTTKEHTDKTNTNNTLIACSATTLERVTLSDLAHCIRMWLVDTGACRDLISLKHAQEFEHLIEKAAQSIKFGTANGKIKAEQQLPIHVEQFQEDAKPYILPKTPAVLSVGYRCRNQGYSFIWPKNEAPYFILPNGDTLTFEVHNNAPYPYHDQEKDPTPRTLYSICQRCRTYNLQSNNDYEMHAAPSQHEDEAQELNPEEQQIEEVMNADDPEDSADRVLPPTTRESLRKQATSVTHLLTHKPKNPYCPACTRAKLKHIRKYR